MVFSLPIVVLLFTIKGINYDIRFNQLEKYGNKYQPPERLFEHISQHGCYHIGSIRHNSSKWAFKTEPR